MCSCLDELFQNIIDNDIELLYYMILVNEDFTESIEPLIHNKIKYISEHPNKVQGKGEGKSSYEPNIGLEWGLPSGVMSEIWVDNDDNPNNIFDLPALVFKLNDKIITQIWCKHGKFHRGNDQPAIINSYDHLIIFWNDYADHPMENGNLEWWVDGKKHRENDQPAVVCESGYQEWWIDGKRHRNNDRPAVDYVGLSREWWVNGKKHRENDRPAIYDINGTKEWWVNGKKHRNNDQPAIVQLNGYQEWYVDDIFIRDNRKATGIYGEPIMSLDPPTPTPMIKRLYHRMIHRYYEMINLYHIMIILIIHVFCMCKYKFTYTSKYKELYGYHETDEIYVKPTTSTIEHIYHRIIDMYHIITYEIITIPTLLKLIYEHYFND